MLTIGAFAGLFVLAFLIESLLEYVAGLWWVPGTPDQRKQTMPLVGMILGVVLCFGFGQDIMALVGLNAPVLGKIFTGIIVGRGSDYLHQFATKFLPGQPSG